MASAEETHYLKAKEKLEIIEVLIQAKDIARVYREAAKEMDAAGEYEDARELAAEYRRLAEKAETEGKELLYQKACGTMDMAQSEVERKLAIDMFERVKGYKDADKLVEECKRRNTVSTKRKDLRTVCATVGLVIVFLAIVGFVVHSHRKNEQEKKVNLETAEVGEKISFGPYQWVILDRDEDTALLMLTSAEKQEETRSAVYHERYEAVTWEDSTLRAWLNSEFIEKFDEEDRSRILLSQVESPDNRTYGTEGGENTQDYVYLMSIEETETYAEQIGSLGKNWLLRTPGNAPDTVAYVTAEHTVMDYGCPVTWDSFEIHPLIRVKLEQAD